MTLDSRDLPPRRTRPGPASSLLRRLGLFLLLVLANATPAEDALPAAPPSDRQVFDAAVRSLRAGFAAKGASDLADFIRLHPQSPLVPEAILLEARARTDLGQLDAAAGLVEVNLARFGPLTDQALYLLGEIQIRHSDYPRAAATFGRLIRETPESPLLLGAAFSEALARFRAGEWARTAALLSDSTNAFVRAAAAKPDDDLVVRGGLLLAECQLNLGAFDTATTTLDRLTNRPLSPPQAWERQFLVTSLQLTNRQTTAALAAATNLLALAESAGSKDLVARSRGLQASALRLAGRPAEAFAALTNNLAEGTPPEWRRDAILTVAQLPLDGPRIEPAIGLLTPLAAGPPQDFAAAAARLAVAELRLQQFFGDTTPDATNRLAEARPHLVEVASQSSAPTLAARAWYHLGWCDLAAGNLAASTEAFGRAAGLLPSGTLQALALFKQADGLVLLTNHAAAVTNYVRVIREYGTQPAIRESVLERALYQGALAALDANKPELANELAGRAIAEFPDGEFRDDTGMLFGQALVRLDAPGRAETVLRQLATRLKDSPALPGVQLAVARSFLREENWPVAWQQLEDWTRANPQHPAIARAEFERAWAAFKAGQETRAYTAFTNFLARFPDDPAAPRAQIWVADHHYRGANFVEAEGAYQLVFQRTNWPTSRLTHEARLMAGRAAFARQGYKDAKTYFRWLIANGPPAVTNSLIPPDLVARAYFALGDAFLLAPESDDRLTDATTAFATVIEKFPRSREALLARGKLANCHLQLAELDPAQATAAYTNAARLYTTLMDARPPADIATRSQAEVGLALVLEKQAARAAGTDREKLVESSLDHLLNVFHGRNLSAGETASAFWLNRAGIEAARISESLGRREQAAAVYDTLARTFPASAAAFRQRAAQLRAPR